MKIIMRKNTPSDRKEEALSFLFSAGLSREEVDSKIEYVDCIEDNKDTVLQVKI